MSVPASIDQSANKTRFQIVISPYDSIHVLIDGSGGRSDGGIAVFKREYAGTGVFLPRRYCNALPELKKKPACSPAQLPAGVAQSFTKNMDPIIAQARPNIHRGFAPQYVVSNIPA
ncbi:hypothetical protein L1887_00879 [Cichorium endivia]|nr:hypothetical protein L1887_00879 [Cichorium endivia]